MPAPISGSGAYRMAAREAVRQRGIRGIPSERVEEISPSAWFDKWWQANLGQAPPLLLGAGYGCGEGAPQLAYFEKTEGDRIEDSFTL